MGSLIKVVSSHSRLPIINRCLISSRALATQQQRHFIRSCTTSHGLIIGGRHNTHNRRGFQTLSASNIVTHIRNRFGIYKESPVYATNTRQIEPKKSSETEKDLCYYIQMNGVKSHEKVRLSVFNNRLHIEGVVHDEFKAAHGFSMYDCLIYLPKKTFYLKYNMRDIKADINEGGELKITVPKFNEAEQMANEKKKEAGEFSKLKPDAFVFTVKVGWFLV